MTEIDLGDTVAPKSDQANADDLLAGPQTVTILAVSKVADPQQPILVKTTGFDGRPWKPCKTMRRVLIAAWGRDGANYVGKRVTLYCDKDVQFGNQNVGGIRISHMSDIDKPKAFLVTEKKGKKVPFKVEPLTAEPPTRDWRAEIAAASKLDELRGVWEAAKAAGVNLDGPVSARKAELEAGADS